MTVSGEQLELGTRDGLAVVGRVSGRNDGVGLAVQHMHRHRDPRRPRQRTAPVGPAELHGVIAQTHTTQGRGAVGAEGEQVGVHARIGVESLVLQRAEPAA
jgi:hypothetical protein